MPGGAPVSRRGFTGLLLACALAGAAGGVPRARAQGKILVVSRDRVLRDSVMARRLSEAERQMTRQLQASVDAAKAQLAEEEAQLTQLRTELDDEAFDARAQDFDRRIRSVRREAQERASFVQRGFQEARAAIVNALPALIDRVRREEGAAIVLNAEQVLSMQDGIDRTDMVIQLLDTEGPRPPIPQIDLSRPLLEPPADLVEPEAQDAQ